MIEELGLKKNLSNHKPNPYLLIWECGGQGQEEKIIFISTVLTRPKPPKKKEGSDELEQTIGFLGNAKRFNVAITRAKVSWVGQLVSHP